MYITLNDIIARIHKARQNALQPVKVAIAISGGGARGAYAAGVVEALLQRFIPDAPQSDFEAIRPAIITGTSVGAVVGTAMWVDLMFWPEGRSAADIYYGDQCDLWRLIADGNVGNDKIGVQRAWILDLLTNKKELPPIDNFMRALNKTITAITLVNQAKDGLEASLNTAFQKASQYPREIFQKAQALEQLYQGIQSNEFRNRVAGLFEEWNNVLKEFYKINLLQPATISLFNAIFAVFIANFNDIIGGQLREFSNRVEALVRAAADITPIIRGFLGYFGALEGSLGTLRQAAAKLSEATADLWAVYPEVQNLHILLSKFIEALFLDPINRPIAFSDHIIGDDNLRSLMRGFMHQRAGHREEIANYILAKWEERRQGDLKSTAPELFLTGADITVNRQTIFAVADQDTLANFATRQLWVMDLTRDVANEPSSPYILYPNRHNRQILLDAIFTSSAFPVAFPTKKWEFRQKGQGKHSSHVFVDGGVCNNSPVDIAAFAGATHIISIELAPLVTQTPTKMDDPENYNLFTVLGPLLETSMASALRNNISALVNADHGEGNVEIYRLAPLLRPLEGEIDEQDPTPHLLDFAGRYDQNRSYPGRLLMNIYDWFMQGYFDCMGYPGLREALQSEDRVVQDYYTATVERDYRKNVVFGNAFWDTKDGAWPMEIPSGVMPLLHEQDGWAWCWKCQGLFFEKANRGSVCPRDGSHENRGSGKYVLTMDSPASSEQHGWKRCVKCGGLFFLSSGGHRNSMCAATGNPHESSAEEYSVSRDLAGYQPGWRWCQNCEGLYYTSAGTSACPRKKPNGTVQPHVDVGSDNYSLKFHVSIRIQSFRSVNFPDHFIRHRNFFADITPIQSDLDQYDASFALVPGLGDPNGLSFESVNYPGYYLRHQDFRLKLHPRSDDQLYRADVTFYLVEGLADRTMVSLRSQNFPDRYIRHRNFQLFLEGDTGGPYPQDVTFKIEPPFKQ